MGAGDPNLGLYICTTITLSTESSVQLQLESLEFLQEAELKARQRPLKLNSLNTCARFWTVEPVLVVLLMILDNVLL